jgi:hypothetical protein
LEYPRLYDKELAIKYATYCHGFPDIAEDDVYDNFENLEDFIENEKTDLIEVFELIKNEPSILNHLYIKFIIIYFLSKGFLEADGDIKPRLLLPIKDQYLIDKMKIVTKNINLYNKYLKSDLDFKEFVKKYPSAIKTSKYGI